MEQLNAVESRSPVLDRYTSKEHWDNYFVGHQPKKVETVFFAEEFDRHLLPDSSKTVLEVGCAGGEYLCYMAKKYGFVPFGVDYSDEIKKTRDLFVFNRLPEPVLHQGDFFTWQPNRTFDVVFSIGFIEHFQDTKSVIRKHVELLAPGGKLIITLPHFAHLQYVFHWLIDRENLTVHNTSMMRLPVIRRALEGLPLKIEQLDYYQTFGFWTERKRWNPAQKAINWVIVIFGKSMWKLMGFRRSNFLFRRTLFSWPPSFDQGEVQPIGSFKMSRPVISIKKLGKCYTLAHRAQNTDGLRHVLHRAATTPLRALERFRTRKAIPDRAPSTVKGRLPSTKSEFWALQDVSFDVEEGDVIGIIGRNGAGKSTLLKVLSRITEPTTGEVIIDGSVVSLLEVGTGFHPELTGRENVFLNGAILGMSKLEIKRKFDEIVAFAEVEEFLDTPVKRYSSGMYVRLAFAVAAHLESQIMLIDEVLAVGDAQFQTKCLGKIQEVASNRGRTVLFVSHNTGVVASLCNKGILLRNGQVAMTGPVREVLQHYTAEAARKSVEFETDGDRAAITRIVLNQVRLAEGDLELEVSFSSPVPLNPPIVGVVVSTVMGVPVFATDPLMHPLDFNGGKMKQGTARVMVPDLKMHPGEYRASVFLAEMGAPLDYRRDALSFEFVPRRPIAAKCPPIETIGPLIVEATWVLEAGRPETDAVRRNGHAQYPI